MTSAESMGFPRRRRGPLLLLLAVDAALAVAGALLLRAGLSDSAAAVGTPASAAPASAPSSASPSSGAGSAPAPHGSDDTAKPASPASPATSRGPGSGDGSATDPGGVVDGSSVVPTEVATAPAPPAKVEPAAPGGGGSSAEPAPTDPATARAAADAEAKAKKRDQAARPAGGRADAPVDPYAPVPKADRALTAQVDRELGRSQGRFDECYTQMMRGAVPTKGASLTVAFRVLADGSLGNATVVQNPTGSAALGNCVLAELAVWSLRARPPTPVDFSRRITFRQAR